MRCPRVDSIEKARVAVPDDRPPDPHSRLAGEIRTRQPCGHHVDLARAGSKPDDFPWLARKPGASFSVDADRAARTPAFGLRTKITHSAPRQITNEQPTGGIREPHHHVPPHIE